MDDTIDIPVSYKSKDLTFIAKFLQFGYSYKFEVDVIGTIVLFERDEERKWRAIVQPANEKVQNIIDKELIQLIGESLEAVLK